MKNILFIFATTLPLWSFSQVLNELPKVEIPKIEVPNLKIPEVKIPTITEEDLIKANKNSAKYFLINKKPESPDLYTILIKKPVENLEKILISKPK